MNDNLEKIIDLGYLSNRSIGMRDEMKNSMMSTESQVDKNLPKTVS